MAPSDDKVAQEEAAHEQARASHRKRLVVEHEGPITGYDVDKIKKKSGAVDSADLFLAALQARTDDADADHCADRYQYGRRAEDALVVGRSEAWVGHVENQVDGHDAKQKRGGDCVVASHLLAASGRVGHQSHTTGTT